MMNTYSIPQILTILTGFVLVLTGCTTSKSKINTPHNSSASSQPDDIADFGESIAIANSTINDQPLTYRERIAKRRREGKLPSWNRKDIGHLTEQKRRLNRNSKRMRKRMKKKNRGGWKRKAYKLTKKLNEDAKDGELSKSGIKAHNELVTILENNGYSPEETLDKMERQNPDVYNQYNMDNVPNRHDKKWHRLRMDESGNVKAELPNE